MAHNVYEKQMEPACPKCGSHKVMFATYHLGASYTAECGGCGFGKVDGCRESMALARHRGKRISFQGVKTLVALKAMLHHFCGGGEQVHTDASVMMLAHEAINCDEVAEQDGD